MALFKPSAKLKFGSVYDYNPQHLKNKYTEKELRKEYTRLRGIATKRLARLEKAGYDKTSAYRYYKHLVKPLKQIKPWNVAKALSSIARLVWDPLTTVTGQKSQRADKIAKLQSYGYDITEKNFDSFTEFMELLGAQARDLLYDSEALVELWEDVRDVVKPSDIMQDFEVWMDNRHKISSVPDIKHKSSKEILDILKG